MARARHLVECGWHVPGTFSSLSDVSSSQFKVTEIAERALAMAERAVPPAVQLNINNNGLQTKASSERS